MSKIEFNNIFKRYKKNTVLDDVSFSVDDSFTFLAGKNGAGKTTLIKLAVDLTAFDSGKITYDGQAFSEVRQQVSVVYDFDKLYMNLSGIDNCKVFGMKSMYDEHTKDIFERLELQEDLLKRKVSTYSFGQKHRLCVAIALLKNPKYLFLDEPTMGLDPVSWELVKMLLLEYKRIYGMCAMITGQDYEEMAQLCDNIVILDKGKIVENKDIDILCQENPGMSLKEIFIKKVGGAV